MFEDFIYRQLTSYVAKFHKAHPDVKLIAVVGSTDKAMTRQAIGTVLSQEKRVRLHEHVAKSRFATPLAVLGIAPPANPGNLLAWWRVFRAARRRIREQPVVDVIVQELTVRRSGDMKEFARYLRPDLAVITSVAPEHLEAFESLDTLAQEYLAVGDMTELVIVNRDSVESRFAEYEHNPNITTYGSSDMAEYWIETDDIYGPTGTPVEINGPEFDGPIATTAQLVGKAALMPALAAAVVGAKSGLTVDAITRGVAAIRTLPGRMNPLHGIGQTLILDDTYRAHPARAVAGLQTLYEFDAAAQRIAVFSSFPELGSMSQSEHERVGGLCNPDLLAWVVVVGEDAAKYLAPAARKKGCQVKVARDAIQAGSFVRSVTEQGAVILVEGASPDTYLEETTKILCNVTEETKLVRQTPEWATLKRAFFDSSGQAAQGAKQESRKL